MNSWSVFQTTVRPDIQIHGTYSKSAGDVPTLGQIVLCVEPGGVVDGDRETKELADVFAGLSTLAWVVTPADAVYRSTSRLHP